MTLWLVDLLSESVAQSAVLEREGLGFAPFHRAMERVERFCDAAIAFGWGVVLAFARLQWLLGDEVERG